MPRNGRISCKQKQESQYTKSTCLTLFSEADTSGKASSDATLVWGDISFSTWLLLHCDLENLRFLSSYAQFGHVEWGNTSPLLLFPHTFLSWSSPYCRGMIINHLPLSLLEVS